MVIVNTDNVGDGGALELNNLKTITTGTVGGDTLVFAGGNDDGISVFRLEDDGTLTSLFNLNDNGALELNNLRDLQFTEVGGNPILIAVGNDDAISTFDVDVDGTLTELDQIENGGALLLNNVQATTTVEVGGTTFVITGNTDSNSDEEGISSFSLAADGTLTLADQVAEGDDAGNLQLDNVRALTSGEVGGTTYVLAGGRDDGISVFSIDNAGNLTNTFNIEDGASPDIGGEDLELNNLTAMTAAVVGGTTYIYAGGEDDGISVFTLNAGGTLTHVHDYEDGGLLQLTNLRSLEIAVHSNGNQFLWVVGDDDAFQSYQIGNDGSLTLVTSVDDTGATYLGNAEDVAYAMVDGEMVALVGGDQDGISVFQVPCFTPGTLIRTAGGDRPVETLSPGDLVITADQGAQVVRFVAVCRLQATDMHDNPQFAPVRIARETFGPGVPARDLVVSPQHRMLLAGMDTSLMFGFEEALSAAHSLVNGNSIQHLADHNGPLTYIHVGFDSHHIIFAENAPTESFFPGPEAINGLGKQTQHELLALFPDLAHGDLGNFAPARPILKHFEGEALTTAAFSAATPPSTVGKSSFRQRRADKGRSQMWEAV